MSAIHDLAVNSTSPTRTRGPSGLRHCLQEGDSALKIGMAKEEDGMRRVAAGEVVVQCFTLSPNFYKPFRHPGEDNPSLLRNKLKFGNMPVGSEVEISLAEMEELGTTMQRVQSYINAYSRSSGKQFLHIVDSFRGVLIVRRGEDG